MKGFAMTVLGIAALVAFVAPHEDRSETALGGGAEKAPAPHATAANEPEWHGDEMALDRAGDGHFYATVTVDNANYRMLVDTGASVVALTGDDARSMGLDWDTAALAPVAQGAGGPVMGVPATIPDMAVGDFEAHAVQAEIVTEGLPVS
jgi:aspartyl protease family protein